jgi:CBS domain-containing protein/uncharacterized protein (DUF2267 family)
MRIAHEDGMSLDLFMTHRLVVQSPDTRIYDAVRAMEDNAIGAVLVHDGECLVGIVTDRDLSLKVIGNDLDAFDFQVRDVMSAPVASVPATASVADIASVMIDRHVRRVPVVDGAVILGIVTLDDLILERGVDAETLAAIIRGQLSEPSRLKPKGKLHPTAPVHASPAAVRLNAQRRHEARRRQAYAKLIKHTLALTELDSAELAEHALLIVISAVLRRLTPPEAADFLAQMPRSLRDYAISNVPSGPDLSIRREAIEAEVATLLDVSPERAARIVRHVGQAVSAGVSRGELNDVIGQLPSDMKEIFAAADPETSS